VPGGSRRRTTRAELAWALDQYAPAGVDRTDPRLSPLLSRDLRGLPPAFIAVPGFDLLRDEALEYARRLRGAGVPTTVSLQPDLTHGYASMLGLGRRFREATAEAALALRGALAG
jgi:acetyl esterase